MTQKKSDSPTRQIVATSSEDMITTYSNHMNVVASNLDFKLVFGQITGADGETLEVQEQVAVYVHPEHALEIARVLERNYQTYTNLKNDKQ